MGGKGGGYSGPTATEIEQQKNMWKQQWDYEAQQKNLAAEQDAKTAEDEKAKTELNMRKGSADVGLNQVGFKRKPVIDEELFSADIIK